MASYWPILWSVDGLQMSHFLESGCFWVEPLVALAVDHLVDNSGNKLVDGGSVDSVAASGVVFVAPHEVFQYAGRVLFLDRAVDRHPGQLEVENYQKQGHPNSKVLGLLELGYIPV